MRPIGRRAFLGMSGVGLAGAAAASLAPRASALPVPAQGAAPASSGAPPAERRVKKALKFGMVQVEGSLEERFRLAKSVGFDGIELDSPSDLDPDEVLAAMAKSGIEIPGMVDSVHWQKTLGDPDPAVRAAGRAALETALRDAQRYGATSVLLVPAVVNQRIPYDHAWARSQAEIRRVLPVAEETGVKIALENVWNKFLMSPLEAARYVDELESEHVGWHLDVGNVVEYGWPEQWVRILGPRVLKLDVKGFSRKKSDAEGKWKGFDAPIGEDDCDWPQVVSALDAIGYRGWASAEVSGGGEERLRDIAQRMDRVFQQA